MKTPRLDCQSANYPDGELHDGIQGPFRTPGRNPGVRFSRGVVVWTTLGALVFTAFSIIGVRTAASDRRLATRGLMTAASRGDAKRVREILGTGISVNTRDAHENTALMWAAAYGQADLLSLLIELGAETNVQNDIGETALMCAANIGDAECIRTLLQNGADPAIRSSFGEGPAEYARRRGHWNIAPLLQADKPQ